MSIVTNVIRNLGIIGSYLPKIAEFRPSFHLVVPFNVRVGRSKAWASPGAAEQFQKSRMSSRALNESLARLHVAR